MNIRLGAGLVLVSFSMFGCLATKSETNQISAAKSPTPLVTVLPSAGDLQPTEELSGTVGGRDFHWDGKDLTITLPGGKRVKVFSELANSDYRSDRESGDATGCLTSYYYRPLGIAGRMVSIEYESAVLCGAINTPSWGYATFELDDAGRYLDYSANTKRPARTEEPTDVPLSAIFPEHDIFKAFMANERIAADMSRLIDRGKIDKMPSDLKKLKLIFDRLQAEFLDGRFYLDAQMLEGFSLHHVEGDKVVVWISLTAKARAAQAAKEHLELRLPIPEGLGPSLRHADAGDEGFLMNRATERVGGGFSKFEFGKKSQ